jgi:hypothetical protein
MDEVQEPSQSFRQRLFRRIAGPDDRVLEHVLHAETGECGGRCRNRTHSEKPEGHSRPVAGARLQIQLPGVADRRTRPLPPVVGWALQEANGGKPQLTRQLL